MAALTKSIDYGYSGEIIAVKSLNKIEINISPC